MATVLVTPLAQEDLSDIWDYAAESDVEFLGLTPEESALIEIKLASARKRCGRRQKRMKACL